MSRNSEAKIQAGIVAYIRAVAPDVLVFHPANGGLRTKAEAALLKWVGVVAGIPDLVIIAKGGKAMMLEVKTAKTKLSESQVTMFDLLDELEVPHRIVRSIDDAREALADFGVESREVMEAA